MSDIVRALGVHTYFPGFEQGLRSHWDVDMLGSVETWPMGIEARALIGLDEVLPGPADLVFSNPPCSRFSTQSSQAYDADECEELQLFCELESVFKEAIAREASTIWWETGPLAWTKGEWLIHNCAEWLRQNGWPAVTTLTLKYDPRWHGEPQRRPRVHVIHSKNAAAIPCVGSPDYPRRPVYEVIQERLGDHGIGPIVRDDALYLRKGIPLDAPASYTIAEDAKTSKFMATRPRIVDSRGTWAYAHTARRMAWTEPDRFWGLHEYAALTTYPIPWIKDVGEHMGIHKAMTLMAKCVMPSASHYVYQHFVRALCTSKTPARHTVFYKREMVVPRAK